MTITLPEDLRGLLSELGFEFPTADEDKIAELGSAWSTLGLELSLHAVQVGLSAAGVWSEHSGKDIDAFKTWWEGEDNPPKSLPEGATAAAMTGTALQICANIVIGLKMYIIAELAATVYAIAAAVAAAVASGGLGGAAVVAIKQAAKEAIGWAIEEALTQILEG
ncbi:hypothetical protein O1R50_20235 [Glycomyces luteolus]|uniref:Outer membrane channel protein CpnT-like N-terminal domain-containing protein n=1 Tax=Glycomyces luteolus TaxID=2670330 RepID=A0A9X3PAR1_9ACTN|nr:hypothetical protein [Glycomyces luteolus]MDA1361968.1 hypothetical protein [Glycomyces luteolus]